MKNIIDFRKLALVVFLFFTILTAISQDRSSFTPGQIWYDRDGNPINAHAGGILYHDDAYYWFGQIMIPGKRGSDAWVGVSCYQSKDLYNWDYRGVAFHVEDHASHPVTRGCKIERPKVIYNPKNQKFVMWWHHDINGQGHSNAMVGIATSDHVEGPYEFVRVFRPLPGFLPFNISDEMKETRVPDLSFTHPFSGGSLPMDADALLIFKRDLHTGQMARDMTLFVDDDGKAYHLYASEENSTLHIAELSDDYMGYTGKYARAFPGRFMEAPTIFKKDGKYFIIASGCTGWEPNAARSAVAESIFGPWKELGNPCIGAHAEITFNSQGTYVLPVQGKKDAFIFVADRWKPQNPIDARYVWLPVDIENGKLTLEWKDQWDLDYFE